jgi:XTP/dITP diphosphohydrolase
VSPAGPRLLIATFNPGKARELARLMAPLGIAVAGLSDIGIREPYEETAGTYEENARGKAVHYAGLAGLPALADDSGLEVDALGGRPGPLSARYGGPELDDAGRCRLLLRELEGVPEEKRTARYVAVAALARPDLGPDAARDRAASIPAPSMATRLFRATCEGRIASEARGSRGFGYDPIFFYPPFGATFGETPDAEKDRVSHRGHALAMVAAFLKTAEGKAFLSA